MYQIGIERRSPVGADNRSRTDHLDLGKVAFCQLNYVRKLQRWRPMRVLPHLPGPMPDSEHRSCPARRHTRRQRFYNLPELLEIVSSARLFRDGPDELPPGLSLLAETPRFAGCLDELFQFVAHFLFPWLLPLLVGADGFEPPCLVRPDLQSGAFNRSATHPKTCLENAQGPESCSEHPGLVAFDLSIYRLELSISIRDACLSVPIVVLISKRRTNWAACG
jgi:hypothetical protein